MYAQTASIVGRHPDAPRPELPTKRGAVTGHDKSATTLPQLNHCGSHTSGSKSGGRCGEGEDAQNGFVRLRETVYQEEVARTWNIRENGGRQSMVDEVAVGVAAMALCARAGNFEARGAAADDHVSAQRRLVSPP